MSGLDVGEGSGESARQRIAEAWALKRKESANWTDGAGEERSDIDAVMPCSTRSYEPAMIWMTAEVAEVWCSEPPVFFATLLGEPLTSDKGAAPSSWLPRFLLAISVTSVVISGYVQCSRLVRLLSIEPVEVAIPDRWYKNRQASRLIICALYVEWVTAVKEFCSMPKILNF